MLRRFSLFKQNNIVFGEREEHIISFLMSFAIFLYFTLLFV